MKALLALAAALGLAGCTLFEDLPDRSCSTNRDCYTAQGEVCNTTTKTCELAPDAAVTVDVTDDDADDGEEAP